MLFHNTIENIHPQNNHNCDLSAKELRKETLLFTRVQFLLHLSCRIFVIILLRKLISSEVVFFCSLEIIHLLIGIRQPTKRNDLLFIQFCRLLETGNSILVIFEPEVCSAFVMVVDGMLRLQLNRPVVTVNSPLIIFDLVIGCAQITVIGRHLRIDLYRFGCQLDLLLEVTHLTHCLSFQVQKITGIVIARKIQSLIASLRQFFPPLKMQKCISLKQILFLGIGHGVSEREQLLILFLGLKGLYFLGCFLVCLEDHRSTVLEIIKLYLHNIDLYIIIRFSLQPNNNKQTRNDKYMIKIQRK